MKKAILTAAALFLVFSFASAQEDTKYTDETVARVSHLTGKIFVQRASDLGFEDGALNMPISEGDRLGTTEGRAEIHFGRGNYLRLDDNTKLDILNLPKKGDEITRIRVWSGNVFLTVGTLSKEKGIEIHTADSSFYVLDRGVYRIDVRENRDSEILVYSGLIEAAGEEGSVLVKGEQRLEVSEGRFLSKPSTFIAVADDSFDRWNESRSRETSQELAESYLPEELGDYEYELSQYGDWTYLAPYGYVWSPRGVGDDWRPYWNGRWVWLPVTSWTWMPYDPWGWATFHYGRWHWGVGLGWYWIPMGGWGPGWVNWWWGYDYYGWAPMSWWGYPGVVIGGAYWGSGYPGGYYPYNSRALTVVHKNQLKSPNISRVAVSSDSLKSLNRMSLTSKSLPVRPVGSKISVQPLQGKQLMLQKDLRSGSLESTPRIRRESVRSVREPSSKVSSGSKSGAKASPASGAKPGVKTGPAKKSSPPKSTKAAGSKIKKKDGDSGAGLALSSVGRTYPSSGAVGSTRATTAKTSYGYPSSPSISRAKLGGDYGASRSGSFLGRISRALGGGSSSRMSSPRSGSSTRSSSRGRISSGRSSGASRSSGPSRGSSGASRSSGGSRSAGGSIRKK
jgi:hypothetical protein